MGCMRKRHRDSASKVLNDAGFKVVRYEPKVEAQKNSTGRTTYQRDCVVAVVNHQLPYYVLTYNADDTAQRKLWNFGRAGEADLFVRLLERVAQHAAPRITVDNSTFVELTHDEFENIRAGCVCTNKAVLTVLQDLGMNGAAYNLMQIDGRLYDSGLDRCSSCGDWTEERDLNNVHWHCPSCAERAGRQLAMQVHC